MGRPKPSMFWGRALVATMAALLILARMTGRI
jgi:hypothetical protein